MAQTVVKFCKQCNEDVAHWDNRMGFDGTGKTNPKAPDFKCSVCKAGIWDKSFDESVSVLQRPNPKDPIPQPAKKNEKSFYYSYAKDIVVALINQGKLDNIAEAISIICNRGDEMHDFANGVK